MNKQLLQAWNRTANLSVLSLLLIPAACMVAVLSGHLHAQQAVAVDEQIFYLKDGMAIRDVSTPSRGNEISMKSAPGLPPQALTDRFGEDVMDVQLGDIDNDGDDELVLLGRTKLAVFELNGGNYELAPEKTLQLYDRSIYDTHPMISFDGIVPWLSYLADWGIPAKLVSEEDWSGGRLTIGDADNDGENEVILTRTSAYSRSSFPFSGYYIVAEILKWEDGGYVLVDVFRRCSLNDGIFILDLDRDGANEIMMGRGTNYGVFGHVENPQDYPTDETSIYGQGGSYTGQYQSKGVLSLAENTHEISQVSAITIQDGMPIIFRVGLAAMGGESRVLGTIRSYVLDPARIPRLTSERLLQGTPAVPNFSGEDLEEKYRPVQVPTTGDLLQRRADVNGLSVGDYDGDGELDIVVNVPGQARIYKLRKEQ